MKWRVRCVALALITIAFHLPPIAESFAEDVNGVRPSIIDLSPPKYPPLARVARVSGDVKLDLQLRPDGTVSSVRLVGGHPLLAPAAAENAKSLKFACYGCKLPSSYTVNYTFGFRGDTDCSVVTLRAPKCLYLWRCGKTFYKNEHPPRPPVIVQSDDRITVGVDGLCVETETTENRKQQGIAKN